MTGLVSPIVIQFVGFVIVAAVVAQVFLMVIHSVRRLEHEKARHDISLDLLRARVSTTMAQAGVERDRSELSWNGFRKFEIQKKVPEAPGVHSFYLVPHDGKKLPPFQPGQYLTFQLRLPNEPKPIVRCYSCYVGEGRVPLSIRSEIRLPTQVPWPDESWSGSSVPDPPIPSILGR